MEEEIETVDDKPSKDSGFNWKRSLITVGIVIVTAGVIGGSVWYIMDSNMKKERAASDKSVAELQKTINDLSDGTKTGTGTSTTTTLTNDQIFQEVSSQLGLSRANIYSFRIFGQDKVQYSLKQTSAGTNFAYKNAGTWKIAQQKAQSVAQCSTLTSVPINYRPPCSNSDGTTLYLNSSSQSTNYPPSSAVSYIGQ